MKTPKFIAPVVNFITSPYKNYKAKRLEKKQGKILDKIIQDFIDKNRDKAINGVIENDTVKIIHDSPNKQLLKRYICTVEQLFIDQTNINNSRLLVSYENENSEGDLIFITDIIEVTSVQKFYSA